MKWRNITWIMVLGGIFYFGMFADVRQVHAGHGTHLVISEIQITGGAGATTNDFVELYNPTGAPIDLDGMRLVKRTATGTTDTTLKSWTSSALVPAHGWYLWANSGFATIASAPDTTTTGTLADNNGVALRMGAEDTGAIIDSVGWGTAANDLVEGAVFPDNPGANASIERLPGAAEGNGTDTGNNAADFILRADAHPQNSASAPAPALPAPPPPDEPPPAPTGPTAGDLVINEFVPNPLDGVEWIELYNNLNSSQDLSGWRIFDGTGNSILALSGTLSAGGFLAFELSSARLNNGGDIIELRAPGGTVIDSVAYGNWDDGVTSDNAPEPEQAGQSISRKSNGGDTDVDSADFALSDSPTKGESNVIATTEIITQGGTDVADEPRTVASARIVINEFVSDPADGDEWIELFNVGDVAATLDGWWIEEGAGSKTPLSGTFIPGQFIVVEPVAGNLNNAGDVILLKDDRGEVIDQVAYGAWEDGGRGDNAPAAADPNSVARRQDGLDTGNDAEDFTVTTTPTKGAPNRVATGEMQSEAVRDIIINEALPNPVGADDTEWIEFFNAAAASVSLSGARIEDESGASYTFGRGDTIGAGGFFIVRREDSHIALNNTSETLSFFAPDDTLLDRVQWQGAKEGAAYARDGTAWKWTSQPTLGEANTFDAPAQNFPESADAEDAVPAGQENLGGLSHDGTRLSAMDITGRLFISEILPDPVGSDSAEWVELFWGGSEEINLSGFILDDAEGGSRPKRMEGVRMKAGAFAVFPKSLTGLTLNNGGDEVRLYDPAGTLVDSVEYEGSVEGRSFARRSDAHWFWTAPSPGARNAFDSGAVDEADEAVQISAVRKSQSAKIQDVTLSEARETEAGTRVRLEGVVSVLPGVFSTQYFYIAEGAAGVQVYSFKKDFPELKIGDRVRVQGEISLPGGQTRVKTKTRSDITVVSSGQAPEPLEATADMLGEDLEGALLRVFGVIVNATRSGIILDDGTGEALIDVKAATGIETRDLVPGTEVAVTGIVGQTQSGYRVLPRFEEDIEILGQDELLTGVNRQEREEGQGATSPYAKATAAAGGGAAFSALAIRRRKLFVNGLRAALFLVRKGKNTV